MESSIIRQLAEVAHQAPSADNSQPWRLDWNGEFLGIFYDTDRVSGKTFPPESPASLLSIGAVIENLMSAATAWGLGPRLDIAATPGHEDGLYARIEFGEESGTTPTPTTPSLLERHTNRGPYRKSSLPEQTCAQLEAATEGPARTWFSQDSELRKRVARLVRMASEIRFQTQEVHEWLGKSLRFTREAVASGDGMDVATLGLPPGGGYLLRLMSDWKRMRVLNTLGMYKVAAAIDSAPIGAGPGLLAVISTADAHGVVNAGRLLERLWYSLNEAGLAAHPYYVVADQLARLDDDKIPTGLEPQAREIALDSRELFDLSAGETLHMLFRVGYPRRQARRSLRVSLDTVFNDQTL